MSLKRHRRAGGGGPQVTPAAARDARAVLALSLTTAGAYVAFVLVALTTVAP